MCKTGIQKIISSGVKVHFINGTSRTVSCSKTVDHDEVPRGQSWCIWKQMQKVQRMFTVSIPDWFHKYWSFNNSRITDYFGSSRHLSWLSSQHVSVVKATLKFRPFDSINSIIFRCDQLKQKIPKSKQNPNETILDYIPKIWFEYFET